MEEADRSTDNRKPVREGAMLRSTRVQNDQKQDMQKRVEIHGWKNSIIAGLSLALSVTFPSIHIRQCRGAFGALIDLI